MPFEIPNYDSIVGRAARVLSEDSLPVAPAAVSNEPVVDDNGWDPNHVELDMEELAECLSRP